MRFAIGGFPQETVSSVREKSTLEWFKKSGYYVGKEIVTHFKHTNSVLGAILDAAEIMGWEMVPTILAGHPLGLGGGPVTREAFDTFLGEMLEGIKNAGKLDGVFVLQHGTMIADGHLDADGDILAAIRQTVGEDVPMAVTYDFQGAISRQIIEKCDIVTGYDTYPHVDWYERGFESAVIMNSVVQGKVKPTRVLRKPRILPNLPGQYTGRHPMATLMNMVHRLEREDGVVAITVNAGHPSSDTPNGGLSIVVITNNDEKLAARMADELEEFAWKEREGFVLKCLSVKEAVDEALRPEQEFRSGPVVLVDQGDSVGSHSYGDGTSIFREMLRRGVTNCAVAYWSPECVGIAIEAGIGNTVEMDIGGKTDEPLHVKATVKVITDGFFEPPVLKGRIDLHSFNMGKTATLSYKGNDIVFTSSPCQFNFLDDWRHVGVEPTRKDFVVVKSPVHFREHFEPIARKIIDVDTPGLTPVDLTRNEYTYMRRPIYPLDKF